MKPLAAMICVALVCVCALFGARVEQESLTFKLRLTDASTGKPRGGIVRLRDTADKTVALPGVLPRLLGVKVEPEFDGWHVVPAAGVAITLPRGVYRGEAVSGLETLRSTFEIDLHQAAPATVVPLKACFQPERHGLVAGNTHLHLMKLSKEQAENYLKQVPGADNLRVVFLSYLERVKADAEYITNRYPIGDLREFDSTGVLFNNGEEHRHNFGAQGEGYGHVMFLGIKNLVKPVSLGAGITGAGFDDRPLRPGIDDAKRQGGTIIWCHNGFGQEDVPSAVTGRLDALNVFDGSRRGGFDITYYHYLNIGLRLPISTGTDWFLYDFARVYAKVEGELTTARWLEALRAGRNIITNGPLVTLRVGDQETGGTLRLDKSRPLAIIGSAEGRLDFGELQLVHNGKVIQRVKSSQVPGQAFRAQLKHEVRVDGPGWFAARIESTTKNELGHALFAHTSPVFVEQAGNQYFDIDSAQTLLKQVEDGQAALALQGAFSTPAARAQLLSLYDEAANVLRKRINERK